MKASELAYKAAQEMTQRGHCKKISEDKEGRVCFYGAISRAEGIEPLATSLGKAFPLNVGGEITYGDELKGSWNLSWLSPSTYLESRESPERTLLIGIVKDILLEREVPDWEYPHQYNDRPDITGEDVILLLKEAGSRLERRGE